MARASLKILDNWEEILCILLLAASVAVGAAGVLWRYVLGSPFVWTEETLRLLLVWLTFVGMSMGIKKGAHMRLDLVDNVLSSHPKAALETLNRIFMLVFAAVLVLAGWRMVAANEGVTLVASGLPAALFYIPLVLGGVSMAVRLVVLLYGAATGRGTGKAIERA